MTSRVVTFRVNSESIPGQILEKWEGKGWDTADVMRQALEALDGIEPPKQDSMDELALSELRAVTDKLEQVAARLANGGVLTEQAQDEIKEAITPQFISNVKKIVRTGARPEKE